VNSLCADSNALIAAASSNVGCGGGGSGFFGGGAITRATGRGGAFTTFVAVFLPAAFARVLATGFAAGRLAAAFFVVVCLSAFRARAFPAGERLVAGLRRVDFTALFRTVEDFDPDRDEERDESRLCVFAI
jgi:hypothetical protein